MIKKPKLFKFKFNYEDTPAFILSILFLICVIVIDMNFGLLIGFLNCLLIKLLFLNFEIDLEKEYRKEIENVYENRIENLKDIHNNFIDIVNREVPVIYREKIIKELEELNRDDKIIRVNFNCKD